MTGSNIVWRGKSN